MKPKPLELSFTPADNQRLANLCGVLDENLKQVETALDVTISRRGERFSLHGDAVQTRLAADVLRRFYNQSRHHLSLEQIQLGLIEAKKLKLYGKSMRNRRMMDHLPRRTLRLHY